MKILIAYDGSEASDDALNDLERAGLPDRAEVRLITVADVFLPPAEADAVDERFTGAIPLVVQRAHQRAAATVDVARRTAEVAGLRLRSSFPRWKIRTEAFADSPAWAIVRLTDEWHPDLVVVGAEGDSSWGGRLILGSVAQRVLYEAPGSVRVARAPIENAAGPRRIIIGYDGSPHSALAVDAVAARNWPARTEVRIIMVLDGSIFASTIAEEPEGFKGLDPEDAAELEFAKVTAAPAVRKLQAAGLIASDRFFTGRPKQLLVEEAANWRADAIFLGANGVRGVERFLLGSVAAAVAARAACSVEIIRTYRSGT